MGIREYRKYFIKYEANGKNLILGISGKHSKCSQIEMLKEKGHNYYTYEDGFFCFKYNERLYNDYMEIQLQLDAEMASQYKSEPSNRKTIEMIEVFSLDVIAELNALGYQTLNDEQVTAENGLISHGYLSTEEFKIVYRGVCRQNYLKNKGNRARVAKVA